MRIATSLCVLVALAGCATEKIAASDALGPVLTVHTIPSGSAVYRDGKLVGTAPVDVPVKRGDKEYALEARHDGFLAAKVVLEAADLQKAGGGETWIALKPESMGTDTPDIDAMKAPELDRGGIALLKKKQCQVADQYFVRALQVDPSFAKAHRDRARCLVQLKNYDLAATELESYLNTTDLPREEQQKIGDQISKLRGRRDIDLEAGR